MKTKHSFTVTIVFFTFLTSIFISNCKFSFANTKRPKEGTIKFGTIEKPKVEFPAQLTTFKTIFADIAEKVVPTVVSVIPTKIDTLTFYKNPYYQFFDEPRDNNPFGFFFGRPHRKQRREPRVEKREYRQQGLGSGVIVSEDGYILTNYHVVSGADEIEVKISDGRKFEADIVGTDSLSDVAVIKIKEEISGLPVAFLGNSDKLRPGDWAIAVGNPFSLTSTVTAGIISALGRKVSNSNYYQNFIQTDAAINPGNSGGALVNIDGELIGINTMIYTRSGGYMGIGFAIPINMARRIMEDLIYRGKVHRGWLGVAIQDINQATREALELGSRKGVLISDVYKGQPAAKAGIKRGDIVLSVDGHDVPDANQLLNAIAGIRPDKTVTMRIFRNGKEIKLKVKMAERDEDKIRKLASIKTKDIPEKQKSVNNKKLGIKVGNLTPETRKQFNIPRDSKGVVVLEIDPSSGEAYENIQKGDIISKIKVKGKGLRQIHNTADFKRTVKSVDVGDSILFLIKRGRTTLFVGIKIKK